jgi:hypothetical protein
MSLSFRKAGARGQWWGGPLVRAGRPRPALSSKNQVLATIEAPARGPAADQSADQGVRPTNYAGVRSWETKWHWAEARHQTPDPDGGSAALSRPSGKPYEECG